MEEGAKSMGHENWRETDSGVKKWPSCESSCIAVRVSSFEKVNNTKWIRETLTWNQEDTAIWKGKESEKWPITSISKATSSERNEWGDDYKGPKDYALGVGKSRSVFLLPEDNLASYFTENIGAPRKQFPHISTTESTTHLYLYPFLFFPYWYMG